MQKRMILGVFAAVLVAFSPVYAEECPDSVEVPVYYSRSEAQLVRDGEFPVFNGFTPDTTIRDLRWANMTLRLWHWDRSMYTEQVLARFKGLDQRPATLKEVLSIGIRNSEALIGCGTLVALGTTEDGLVPFIGVERESGKKYLSAQGEVEEWKAGYFFVAVDKNDFAEPTQRSASLPRFELTGGVMLPGFYSQDTSGGVVQDFAGRPREGEGSWGVSLIGANVTFLRWGRLHFGGVAVVFGARYSGWAGTYDQDDERDHGLSMDIIAATPVLFRISHREERLKNAMPEGEWYLYGAYGWNVLRASREGYNGQKGNWLVGVAYNFSR